MVCAAEHGGHRGAWQRRRVIGFSTRCTWRSTRGRSSTPASVCEATTRSTDALVANPRSAKSPRWHSTFTSAKRKGGRVGGDGQGRGVEGHRLRAGHRGRDRVRCDRPGGSGEAQLDDSLAGQVAAQAQLDSSATWAPYQMLMCTVSRCSLGRGGCVADAAVRPR